MTLVDAALVDGERIALVLAGGGARGAYEAGALSILLPELARLGQRPTMFVGTSVGAMNAAYLASAQHQSPDEAGAGLIACWKALSRGDVMRPLYRQLPLGAVRYAGEVLSVPGLRLSSLLDPGPLERSLERWINFSSIHQNVAGGVVAALAVVATAVHSGRSVVFVEGGYTNTLHRSHIIDYVPATVGDTHLRASAALPVLFPPVRIETPAEARGWYVDGGTRLNTPIKPALDLGATRIVVVGTDAIVPASDTPGRHEGKPPDLVDGALHLLEGALVDPLAEDIVMLGNVNMFYADPRRARAAKMYRQARGKTPYRRVPYLFVAPDRRGAIGKLAMEIFRLHCRRGLGPRSLRMRLFGRLLGGESPSHGELLSYVLFEREFLDELIAMGQRDAQRWFAEATDPTDPWQVGPLPALTGTT